MKLDLKDRKIIAELLQNSRTPITIIAKKCGISREVANYRINKLNKEIINNYITTINFRKLGFSRNICFVQLKGITPDEEDVFLDFLSKHPFVTYMGPIIGKWNIVCDIVSNNEEHLKKIVSEIKRAAGKHLESMIINGSGIAEEIFPTKYVGVNKQVQSNPKKSKSKIDDIDLKILKLLSINSRIEYKDLSRKLKMSANAIKYRIKAMEKSDIIEGYTISLDFRKLDIHFYNLQFKIDYEIDKRLVSFIRNHKRMVFYYKYLGQENWDIDIGIIVENHEELRKIMLEIKQLFGEHIKLHDLYVISHVIKDNICPEGVFLQ